MCGIAGFFATEPQHRIETMTEALKHRGPDSFGTYYEPGLALGHTRLSIIDVDGGQQPMFDHSKNWVIVFNGEIYNYQDLRNDLKNKGCRFRTNSDTEVILEAYKYYGKQCLQHFQGMFAFAIWNQSSRELFLARDRFGMKPLYYRRHNNDLYFASEYKALLDTPGFQKKIQPLALYQYLSYRYVPGDLTMFDSIVKLAPAHCMTVSQGTHEIKRYWHLENKTQTPLSEAEYVEEFRRRLDASVKSHMISDVPVGAFLSGGIDSAAIVALMQKHATRPVETFTIGFHCDVDENDKASKLAKHLGTTHRNFYINPDDYRQLPEIAASMDDPLGDAIILPLHQLCQHAAQHLKVVLTGEGADEILGGYVHQMALHKAARLKKWLPGFLPKLLQAMIAITPLYLLDKQFPYPASLGTQGKKRLITFVKHLNNPANAYDSLASLFAAGTCPMHAEWNDELHALQEKNQQQLQQQLSNPNTIFQDTVQFDLTHWLPDNILFKQDKLSMAAGLETRVPFLDHRLAEFAVQSPIDYKFNNQYNKSLLRKAVQEQLPPDIVWQEKHAFYIPTEKVFDKQYQEFVRDHLNKESINKHRLLDYDKVDSLINQAFSDKELLSTKRLDCILMLQLWADHHLQ